MSWPCGQLTLLPVGGLVPTSNTMLLGPSSLRPKQDSCVCSSIANERIILMLVCATMAGCVYSHTADDTGGINSLFYSRLSHYFTENMAILELV